VARTNRQATGEVQSFGLPRRDIDQHDVGTKRRRCILRAFPSLEARYDREPLGLKERLLGEPTPGVGVEDPHTNLRGSWLPCVLLLRHASSMLAQRVLHFSPPHVGVVLTRNEKGGRGQSPSLRSGDRYTPTSAIADVKPHEPFLRYLQTVR
jgi:hypothetical protein